MLKAQRTAAAATVALLDILSLFIAFAAAWALRDSLGDALLWIGGWLHLPFQEMVRRPGDLSPFYQILLSRNPLISFSSHLWMFWISLPLWIYFLRSQRGYDLHEPRTARQEFAACANAGFLTIAALVIFLFLAKFDGSRLLIANYFICGVTFVWLTRITLLPLLQQRTAKTKRHVLVIGHKKAALRFAGVLQSPAYRASELIGYVYGDNTNCAEDKTAGAGPELLGCLNDLERILDDRVVDEVVIVRSTADAAQDTPENNRRWGNLLQLCLERGRTVSLFDDMIPPVGAKVEASMMGTIPMLVLHNTPQNPLQLAAKNVIDRSVAFFALLVLSPLFAIIALLIKLHDGGPVFFTQERVGLNGRIFPFYKFRSMHVNAQQILETMKRDNRAQYDAINIMEDPFFKAKDGDDPRITPIGRFIRKYSIDELPQFWNVLKGDMSLVGPRPPLPKEVAELAPWQRRKLSVKGGLTCIWQATGRNDITEVDEWMKLDLEYIDNWSLWLDVKLLFKTLKVLVKPRGAS
jgi:exopolysaccharide biosynthesis polyprenyl glycosylphosphotransferase